MEITRQQLNEWYHDLSTAELREKLGGISQPRLYRLLDRAGIERKIKNRQPRNHIKIKLIEPPTAPELAAKFLADVMAGE
jgi:hypothetical protein